MAAQHRSSTPGSPACRSARLHGRQVRSSGRSAVSTGWSCARRRGRGRPGHGGGRHLSRAPTDACSGVRASGHPRAPSAVFVHVTHPGSNVEAILRAWGQASRSAACRRARPRRSCRPRRRRRRRSQPPDSRRHRAGVGPVLSHDGALVRIQGRADALAS